MSFLFVLPTRWNGKAIVNKVSKGKYLELRSVEQQAEESGSLITRTCHFHLDFIRMQMDEIPPCLSHSCFGISVCFCGSILRDDETNFIVIGQEARKAKLIEQ